jgi:hypothetical protein
MRVGVACVGVDRSGNLQRELANNLAQPRDVAQHNHQRALSRLEKVELADAMTSGSITFWPSEHKHGNLD